MAKAGKGAVRWNDEDPRDQTAQWGDYSLRVKAEQRGTVYAAYVHGPNYEYRSEHVSRDAAKQKAAKVVREAAKAVAAEAVKKA